MNIAKRLKSLRDRLDLTQQEFSEAVGIDQSGYSKYERGLTDPKVSTVEMIAKAFNISLDWLVLGTGNMYPHTRAREEMSEEQAPYGDEVRYEWLTAQGETYMPLVNPGDRVHIRLCSEWSGMDGRAVAVRVGKTVELRRAEKHAKLWVLMPLCGTLRPIVVHHEDEIELIGEVVELRRVL